MKQSRKLYKKSRKLSHRKRSRKSSKKSYRKKLADKKRRCQSLISNKIREIMPEYHSGRYKSRQQAIAVAYSMVKKRYPSCKRLLTKRSRK